MRDYEHDCMDIFVEEAVGRVEREIWDVFVDETLDKELDKGLGMLETVGTPSSMEVEVSEKSDEFPVGAGVKHSRSETGSAIPSSESSSISPPRARKVAAPSSGQNKSEGRCIRYKHFDIAFNDGTEDGGGRIIFCSDKSCNHYKTNLSDNVEDYFLVMEDEYTLEHICLGRVKLVAVDKIKDLLIPGNSRELEVLLAKAGDGCVVNAGFTVVDQDSLSKEKN